MIFSEIYGNKKLLKKFTKGGAKGLQRQLFMK